MDCRFRAVITGRSAYLCRTSRNSYLNPDQRKAATVLYRALNTAKALFDTGERDAARLRQAMTQALAAEPVAEVDYVSIADPDTLKELAAVGASGALASMAVKVGPARLIDNLRLG